ncbi:electron transfer flavoprotein subunit beta/FixA family protein [Devosia sp. 63-57]|uniref:electron transfer flavoprotein subunit beta/FixA family protein n=1 Tax=Devosia sp. 63-57 TaxID=1895751 RepID=UPI00086FA476|nr:electron transfer flavoprotein subunit beta/FixA family protein [Devosia sp. 63-57]ODT47636.1 MAG: electron transfer flavoprotein subunit beta [Pelagibacterium sp. SCN 63-126]ODU88306.1 MAG: electron transfer flavoprotein subunit beta [Pelagibacterium sp. SCN 63-17]OJX42656.1 MAG: electron transfer flavoprotein subunit beta [Devosia sp. 63-57]
MKILVAVKRVVDHNVRIRVRPDGSGVETSGVRMSMNPFCKHAVEAAVQLAEAGQASEIVVVSIGPKASNDVILTALAMGAHRGILLETDAPLETLAIAKLLAKVVEEEQPDLVLLGKQAVDDDSNHVGQMLAALTNRPQATFASEIKLGDGRLEVTREVDYGRETVSLPLPAIVTADLRLNTPRNAALPMVMKARSKPLAVRPAADFGVDLTPRLAVEKVSPPAERITGRTLGSVSELAAVIAAEINAMEAI